MTGFFEIETELVMFGTGYKFVADPTLRNRVYEILDLARNYIRLSNQHPTSFEIVPHAGVKSSKIYYLCCAAILMASGDLNDDSWYVYSPDSRLTELRHKLPRIDEAVSIEELIKALHFLVLGYLKKSINRQAAEVEVFRFNTFNLLAAGCNDTLEKVIQTKTLFAAYGKTVTVERCETFETRLQGIKRTINMMREPVSFFKHSIQVVSGGFTNQIPDDTALGIKEIRALYVVTRGSLNDLMKQISEMFDNVDSNYFQQVKNDLLTL